jgi:flagellar basal body rod protein FlgG
MDASLYLAYAGMRAEMRAVEVTANNLANATTTAFNEERTFVATLEAAGRHYPQTAGTLTHVASGPQVSTGRDLDVALAGDGFLVVATPEGRRYTRNGSLGRDVEGRLVSRDGYPVLGQGGPITLPHGEVDIDPAGRVSVAGAELGRLQTVDLPAASLLRDGRGLFRVDGASERPASVEIHQGYLEKSNVDPVRSTVELVESARRFEALSRVVDTVMNGLNRRMIDSARP